MKKISTVLAAVLIFCLLLSACGGKNGTPLEQAQALIDSDVETLYEAIGEPNGSMYASSCLGEGEDGELYYDGFTVYTYRDTDGSESIYDVMENAD